MSIQAVVDEFRRALKRVEVEFQNSLDEVTMVRDLQKLNLPSGVIENIRAGANLRVYRWVAEKLVEKDLAKPVSGVIDLKLVLQLRWKEKSNQAELQPLPDFFYLKVREELRENQEIIPHLKDIYSLRLSKIMSLAAKRVPRSMVENLTAEEKILYECLVSIVNAWHDFIEGGGDR